MKTLTMTLLALGILVLYGTARAAEDDSNHMKRESGRMEHMHGETTGSGPVHEHGGPSGKVKVPPPSKVADLRALATRYRLEAGEARKNAERHRAMAESYARGTKTRYRAKMKEHCEKIVSLQESLASQFEELASAYEEQAQAGQ